MRLGRARHSLLMLFGASVWAVLCAVAAAPAWAHFAEATGGGWSAGFAHPFSGIDHLVTMIAVGIWAVQIGERAVWLLPASFVLVMALGAMLSLGGVVLPGAEDGIALSVAVLGVLLAVAARPGLAASVAIVALFGLVHGYAHGAEMPEAAMPVLYALGFVAATLCLHLLGIAFGLAARSRIGQRLLPIGAAAMAGIGITLVLAL
jgi:urease accessory protein